MPVADHRHVHAERGHGIPQRQRQTKVNQTTHHRQLDRLGKTNAPKANRRDQDQRGDIITQPFRQPSGDSATQRMADQRELVNVQRSQRGLHVVRVGRDTVACRAVRVAEAGQIDRIARTA